MGALVELFCSVFGLIAQVSEKQNPKMGCLGIIVALVLSVAITWGLVHFAFWLAQ